MRHRPRSPILSLLQLAIFGFVFWQVSQVMSGGADGSPAASFDATFRVMRLVFLAGLATVLLNVLYPLATWGIGRLRERQATWSPEMPVEAGTTEPEDRPGRHCPNCGASLFDDTPTCPWCDHPLR